MSCATGNPEVSAAAGIEDDGSLIILGRESAVIGNSMDMDTFTELFHEEVVSRNDDNDIIENSLDLMLADQKRILEAITTANKNLRGHLSSYSNLPECEPSPSCMNIVTETYNDNYEEPAAIADGNPNDDAKICTDDLTHLTQGISSFVDGDTSNTTASEKSSSYHIEDSKKKENRNDSGDFVEIQKATSPSENSIEPVRPEKKDAVAGNPNGSISMLLSFIQDYDRSLGAASRYIIFASIASFCTAFILLSLYSFQTHRNDMELFKIKGEQVQAQQAIHDKAQSQSVSFRETLIHQRYEEARECRSSLKTCNSKNEGLLVKITKMDKDTTTLKLKLESELGKKDEEIRNLQERVKILRQTNAELRSEVAHSVSSSIAQVLLGLLNILKNQSVQFAIASFIGLSALFLVSCVVTGK